MKMDAEKFLSERRTGIGGSDAAAIAGVDPFRTAYHVALEKLGRLPPREETDQMEVGRLFEDAVARMYARRNGVKVRRMNLMVRSSEHPHMIAHYDRDIVGVPKRLEVKTSGNPSEWGASGSEDIPDRVLIQVQHYLAVEPSLEAIDVALLLQTNSYRQYTIHRRPKLIADLIELERIFWTRLQRGILPEPDFSHASTPDLVAQLYPGTNGQKIELPNLQQWHAALQDAQAKRLMYEKLEQSIRTHIAWEMGEAAIALLPDGSGYARRLVKRKEYVVPAQEWVELRYLKDPEGGRSKTPAQTEDSEKGG